MANIVKLDYTVNEVNERLGRVADRGEFTPVNVLEGLSITYSPEGYFWGSSGLITNESTAKYKSINELIDVLEGYTYKIPKFSGCAVLYGASYADRTQLAQGNVVDFEFTVPEGKTRLGISYNRTVTTAPKAVYRMTPTAVELESLPLINDKLVIQPQNLQSEETESYIRSFSEGYGEDIENLKNEKASKKPSYDSIDVEEIKGEYFRAGTTTAQAAWSYTKINVVEGEMYRVSGVGNGYVHAINYCDNDLNVLSSSVEDSATVFSNEEIKIPKGCTILILNRNSSLSKFSVFKRGFYEYNVAPLGGKIIVNFGDSIFGNYSAPTDISTVLAELTGATVYNCGFGGCRMAKHASSYYDPFSMYRLADAIVSSDFSLQEQALEDAATTGQTGALVTKFPTTLERLKTIDFNEVDIITIAYGTNDWQSGVYVDVKADPKNTIYMGGALRYSIETILTKYPHIKIFVCSPTYRCWNNADGTLDYDSDGDVVHNEKVFTEFVSKQEEIAKEYHLPFIDNYYTLGINRINRLNYFTITDGTHPNFEGRKIIAAHIAKELF